jgi:hypothetical protein
MTPTTRAKRRRGRVYMEEILPDITRSAYHSGHASNTPVSPEIALERKSSLERGRDSRSRAQHRSKASTITIQVFYDGSTPRLNHDGLVR